MKYYYLAKSKNVSMLAKYGPFSSREEREKQMRYDIEDFPKSEYYLAEVSKNGDLSVFGPVHIEVIK